MITSLFSFLESSLSVQRADNKMDDLSGSYLHKGCKQLEISCSVSCIQPSLRPLDSLPSHPFLPHLNLALSPVTQGEIAALLMSCDVDRAGLPPGSKWDLEMAGKEGQCTGIRRGWRTLDTLPKGPGRWRRSCSSMFVLGLWED